MRESSYTYVAPDNAVETYELMHPIEAYGTTWRQLSLRRAIARDLLATDGLGEMGATLKMIALLSGAPQAVVEQLDAADALALGEVIGRFLGIGRVGGPVISQRSA